MPYLMIRLKTESKEHLIIQEIKEMCPLLALLVSFDTMTLDLHRGEPFLFSWSELRGLKSERTTGNLPFLRSPRSSNTDWPKDLRLKVKMEYKSEHFREKVCKSSCCVLFTMQWILTNSSLARNVIASAFRRESEQNLRV